MERLLHHQGVLNSGKENAPINIPDLNKSNYMTSSIKFFPQRVKYPSGIAASNEAGYNLALQFLGARMRY